MRLDDGPTMREFSLKYKLDSSHAIQNQSYKNDRKELALGEVFEQHQQGIPEIEEGFPGVAAFQCGTTDVINS